MNEGKKVFSGFTVTLYLRTGYSRDYENKVSFSEDDPDANSFINQSEGHTASDLVKIEKLEKLQGFFQMRNNVAILMDKAIFKESMQPISF